MVYIGTAIKYDISFLWSGRCDPQKDERLGEGYG